MAHQAEVNTNGKARAAEPQLAASFTGFAHDAIELAELQARLLKLDAEVAAHNSGRSVVLAIVGGCLLMGCVPVGLLALAEWLVLRYGWSHAGGLAFVATCGTAVAGLLGLLAWRRLRLTFTAFERSQEEFKRNHNWIKANLRRDKTSRAVDS